MNNEIEALILVIQKLPGIGPKSAKRLALYMLQDKNNTMLQLANIIHKIIQSIRTCNICNNIDTQKLCEICTDKTRDVSALCIVESVGDLWAIEKNNVYKGLYHVLGGTLSASNNFGPQNLEIERLIQRTKNNSFQEIIIATNATIDGQTTAYYILECLKNFPGKISRLAFGMPIGGELEYLDKGTMSAAIQSRQIYTEN